jgi:hypothetical protein
VHRHFQHWCQQGLFARLWAVLAIILRPDQQDYQGTGVRVEGARTLGVPRMLLLVNKVPAVFDPAEVKARVEGPSSVKYPRYCPTPTR